MQEGGKREKFQKSCQDKVSFSLSVVIVSGIYPLLIFTDQGMLTFWQTRDLAF